MEMITTAIIQAITEIQKKKIIYKFLNLIMLPSFGLASSFGALP